MQENILVETENFRRARAMIEHLENRPKSEMVGLGLIYGPPGLGKSKFAKSFAEQNEWLYLRLEATMGTRVFLLQLMEQVSLLVPGLVFSCNIYSCNEILRWCLQYIEAYGLNIMIDEIDYAFHKQLLLGTIRDIADKSKSIVVLVGMTNAKQELAKQDAHYFDRCNGFVQFKPLTFPDSTKYLQAVSNIDLPPETIRKLHQISHGNVRRLVKYLVLEEANHMHK